MKGRSLFTLAHLSDWHVSTLAGAPASDFLNKRFSGWLSWKLQRRRNYRPEVLEALLADVGQQRPDHVVVTGDLTNVALEQEFIESERWLRALGDPGRVSVIPGNHDAYVPIAGARSLDYWAPYLSGDGGDHEPSTEAATAPQSSQYPVQWVRGEIAFLGVSTALPTAVFQASGRVGEEQLARLGEKLAEHGRAGRCRVVLIHHPPVDEGVSPRRRLLDAAEFRAVIAREGAELVLHGHQHRTLVGSLDGPESRVPVVGVRSSGYVGKKEEKLAEYHLYRIARTEDRVAGAPFEIRIERRAFDRASGAVVAGEAIEMPQG